MYKIVTHPGSAHKDDFLSASVLLATLGSAVIERREARREDIDDSDTYVVDVGMVYDPQNHNFDHHQDSSLPCAFHLVMKHLGYHDAAEVVFGWYSHMSMMDVRGPYKTAEQLGVDTSILFAASSPIDGYILSCFSRRDRIDESSFLYGLMQDLGRDMIAMIDQKMTRLELLKKEVKVLPVRQFKTIFSRIDDNPKLSMELYLNHLDDPRVVMSISPSIRGTGWELLRLGDNFMVDFRALEGRDEIRFIHGNGFVAKTHDMIPMDEVVALASRAISPAA